MSESLRDGDPQAELWEFDDEEMDRWMEEWAEADRAAAAVLAEAWPSLLEDEPAPASLAGSAESLREGRRSSSWPYDYFVNAGETTDHDLDDLALWLAAVADSISPRNDPGTDAEEQSWVGTMQHADWLAIVLGLCRRGVGAELSGDQVAEDVDRLEEIDGASEEDDASAYDAVVTVLTPLWEALGVLDGDQRLTPLGLWGLPRALHAVWSAESR